MMNEEEKFDDLLRKKLSERDFFFDEENWQKLNEKIESQEKKKKQNRFIIIFLGGLAMGIAFTVPVMNLMNNNRPEKIAISSRTEGSTTSDAVSKSQPIAATNPNSTAGEQSGPMQSGNNVSSPSVNGKNEILKEANSGNNAISNKPAIATINNKKTIATNTYNIEERSKTNAAVNNMQVAVNSSPQTKSRVRRNKGITAVNNKTLASVTNKENVKTATESRQTRNKNRNINNVVAANAQAPTQVNQDKTVADKNSEQLAMNNTADKNTQAANNANLPERNVNNNNGTQPRSNNAQSTQQTTANTNATQQNNSPVTTQSQPATNNNTSANNQTAAVTQASNKKADSSQNRKLEDDIDTNPIPIIKPPARLKASNVLSIDAGGGYSLGWKNYGVTEANGFSPVFGISATHFLSKKIALVLSVQYNSLTNLKTSYSNITITYDFGINTNSTSVMPQTIHYIAVPLTLRYYFDDNDAICAGGSFLYLINTNSKVITSSQNQLNPANNQSKSTLGYTQGFNNMDLQAHVGYRRKIYKAFSAMVEGYFGLLDVETSFFSDNTFKRNTGVRLILSYDLIK